MHMNICLRDINMYALTVDEIKPWKKALEHAIVELCELTLLNDHEYNHMKQTILDIPYTVLGPEAADEIFEYVAKCHGFANYKYVGE